MLRVIVMSLLALVCALDCAVPAVVNANAYQTDVIKWRIALNDDTIVSLAGRVAVIPLAFSMPTNDSAVNDVSSRAFALSARRSVKLQAQWTHQGLYRYTCHEVNSRASLLNVRPDGSVDMALSYQMESHPPTRQFSTREAMAFSSDVRDMILQTHTIPANIAAQVIPIHMLSGQLSGCTRNFGDLQVLPPSSDLEAVIWADAIRLSSQSLAGIFNQFVVESPMDASSTCVSLLTVWLPETISISSAERVYTLINDTVPAQSCQLDILNTTAQSWYPPATLNVPAISNSNESCVFGSGMAGCQRVNACDASIVGTFETQRTVNAAQVNSDNSLLQILQADQRISGFKVFRHAIKRLLTWLHPGFSAANDITLKQQQQQPQQDYVLLQMQTTHTLSNAPLGQEAGAGPIGLRAHSAGRAGGGDGTTRRNNNNNGGNTNNGVMNNGGGNAQQNANNRGNDGRGTSGNSNTRNANGNTATQSQQLHQHQQQQQQQQHRSSALSKGKAPVLAMPAFPDPMAMVQSLLDMIMSIIRGILKGIFSPLLDPILEFLRPIVGDLLRAVLMGGMPSPLSRMMDMAKAMAMQAAQQAIQLALQAAQNAAQRAQASAMAEMNQFTAQMQNELSKNMMAAATLQNSMAGRVGDAQSKLQDAANKAQQKAQAGVAQATDKLQDAQNSAMSSANEKLQSAQQKAVDVAAQAAGKIQDVGTSALNSATAAASNIQQQAAGKMNALQQTISKQVGNTADELVDEDGNVPHKNNNNNSNNNDNTDINTPDSQHKDEVVVNDGVTETQRQQPTQSNANSAPVPAAAIANNNALMKPSEEYVKTMLAKRVIEAQQDAIYNAINAKADGNTADSSPADINKSGDNADANTNNNAVDRKTLLRIMAEPPDEITSNNDAASQDTAARLSQLTKQYAEAVRKRVKPLPNTNGDIISLGPQTANALGALQQSSSVLLEMFASTTKQDNNNKNNKKKQKKQTELVQDDKSGAHNGESGAGGVASAVTDATIKELSALLPAKFTQDFVPSMTSVGADTISAVAAAAVAGWTVPRLHDRLRKPLQTQLSAVISKTVLRELVRTLPRSIHRRVLNDSLLIPSTARSIAASTSAAISMVLGQEPATMYLQYYCHAFGMYCEAANTTQAAMQGDAYRAQYYASYYSSHYSAVVTASLQAALDSEERIATRMGTKQRPKPVAEEP